MKLLNAFEKQQELIDIADDCINGIVRDEILLHGSVGGVYDVVTQIWGSGKPLQGTKEYKPFMNKKYAITGELIGDAYCSGCVRQCLKDFAKDYVAVKL